MMPSIHEAADHMHCSYYAAMPAVTIRDVPEATRNTLASRAARNGQSLQEYLRSTLIDFASKPDVGELMDAVAARKQAAGSSLDSTQIFDHLDNDRT